MARTKPAASTVTVSVNELVRAIAALVRSAESAVSSSAEVRAATCEVGRAGKAVGEAATAKAAKLRAAVKASWARYTPKERAARIRKMLAGRGIRPKRRP